MRAYDNFSGAQKSLLEKNSPATQTFKKVAQVYFLPRPQPFLPAVFAHYIPAPPGAPRNKPATEPGRRRPRICEPAAGRTGGVMGSMKNWIFGAAVLAGAVALGGTPAQAAEFGIYVRGPVAYVPPCPGPGYYWTAGYMADGYWIPGRWSYGGYRGRAIDRDDFRHDRDRDFDRDRRYDRDRYDRDRYDRDRDHDRFRH